MDFGAVGQLQTPPLQVCGLAQLEQSTPPVPHASAALPTWQFWFWSQQPAQLDDVQAEPGLNSHRPEPLQIWLPEHATHIAPRSPHCLTSVPAWHPWLVSQQPWHAVEQFSLAPHESKKQRHTAAKGRRMSSVL